MEVGHTGPHGQHVTNHVVEAIAHVCARVHTLPLQVVELIVRDLGTRHEAANRIPFSYAEPFLRAVNGARRGALAKSISNWHLIGYNEGYCSNTGYILLSCFYGIRFWIWPEPLVAPRVRRALGTRMTGSMARYVNFAYVCGWLFTDTSLLEFTLVRKMCLNSWLETDPF